MTLRPYILKTHSTSELITRAGVYQTERTCKRLAVILRNLIKYNNNINNSTITLYRNYVTQYLRANQGCSIRMKYLTHPLKITEIIVIAK